jgi:hypothetical protein
LKAMRQVVLAGMMAVGITLGGCSGYDVELRGGVFDALGVSNLNAKREEPEMNDRPGLVIPPTTAGWGCSKRRGIPGQSGRPEKDQHRPDDRAAQAVLRKCAPTLRKRLDAGDREKFLGQLS